MSFVDFKEVAINDPGTSTKYGSDQMLEIMQIFNNKTVSSRRVRVKNPFQFTDHIELVAPAALPASPTAANTRFLVVDPADNHYKIMKTGGSIIDIDALVANTWNSAAAETITNKTISVDLNPVNHSTTNAAGDLLKNNGTRFARFSKGAALQILRVNTGATDLEFVDPSMISGGGEVNTVSNIGTGTGLVGVFKQKTGVNFEMKSLRAASTNISVIDDVANNRINLDVSLGTITLSSLGGQINLGSQVTGVLPVSNGGTGAGSLTGLLKGSGTSAITALANGSNNQILTMVGGSPSWANAAASGGTAFYPDQTKWGGWWGGATRGVGIFSGADGYGDVISGDQTSSSADQFTVFTTDNADAAIAGFRTPITCTRRDYSPILNFRFKVNNAANSHVWVGFSSNAAMPLDASSDNPVSSATGLLVGFTDAYSNWEVTYNDGSAGIGQFIDTGIAKNTTVHNLQLEFDNAAGKIKATFDGTVYTPAGTAGTPGNTTPMFIHFNVEAQGSNACPLALNYAKLVQNK